MKTLIHSLIIFSFVGYYNLAWAEKACFEVQGMTCATCPITVKVAIKKLNGVQQVKTSFEEKDAVVEFDSKKTALKEIQKAIENVGYRAIPQQCKKM